MDKGARRALDDSSDDEEMKDIGDERVGRKRKRSLSDDDEEMGDSVSGKGKSAKPKGRSLSKLQIRSMSRLRSMSQGRREGSVP